MSVLLSGFGVGPIYWTMTTTLNRHEHVWSYSLPERDITKTFTSDLITMIILVNSCYLCTKTEDICNIFWHLNANAHYTVAKSSTSLMHGHGQVMHSLTLKTLFSLHFHPNIHVFSMWWTKLCWQHRNEHQIKLVLCSTSKSVHCCLSAINSQVPSKPRILVSTPDPTPDQRPVTL